MTKEGDGIPASITPPPQNGWWARRSNWVLVACAGAYVLVGGLILVFVPAPLLENWLPASDSIERGKLLGTAAQILLIAMGGVIAVIGVTLSVARHQEELETQERDRSRLNHDRERESARREEWNNQRRTDAEREFRARFVTTIDVLSSAEPIKRTAALYSLGALADDWAAHGRPDEVQVCINVLCAYLRTPLSDSGAVTASEERAVRQAGYDIISDHMRAESTHDWGKRKFDLNGATIEGTLSMSGATISGGMISLNGAAISDSGRVSLVGATISGGGVVSLSGVRISGHGRVALSGSRISDGGNISLDRSTISEHGRVSLDRATIGEGGEVSLIRATIRGYGRVSLDRATISEQGALWLNRATISEQGRISMFRATISEYGRVSLDQSTISGGGIVALGGATLSDQGSVSLEKATISEQGTVSLVAMTISGDGVVSLDGATLTAEGAVSLEKATIETGGSIVLPDGRRLNPWPLVQPS